MREHSQIEDMRAALRGDIERAREKKRPLAAPPAPEPEPRLEPERRPGMLRKLFG